MTERREAAAGSDRFPSYQSWLLAAGLFPLVLGLVVLAGWHTHTVPLIQLHPALVPMQYNTATGFLCCGLMLLAHWYGMRRMELVFAAIVALIGSLTLVQYIAAVDLGIDQLLLEHYITVATSHPGRMAPNSALSFSLTGAAILLSRGLLPKLASPINGTFGSLVLGLGLAALLGYWLDLEAAFGWGQLSRMAIHTAFGFIVLGFGLLAMAWQSDRATEKQFPGWLPVPAGIAVLTVTFSLWQALHPARDHSAHQGIQHLVLIFGIALAAALSLLVSKVTSEIAARRQLELEVAERERAETKLRESEQRMVLALRGADLGTWDWNVQTGEVIFNDRFAMMLNYALDELKPVLETWESAVHPDDMPGVQQRLTSHLEGRTENYQTEHRVRNKAGRWVWVLDKGKVIERDAHGKPLRMCGTHLDITKRKQAEKVLQQYEHIVSSTSDMLALFDKSHVYLAINKVYVEALGKTAAEVIGHSVGDVLGEKTYSRLVRPSAERCLAGEDVRYRQWFDFPAHGRRYMDILYSPYRGPDGEILGYVVSGRDITEHQKLQEQLLQSQKMESVGQLAGGLAHDFNNMLAVIVGNAELAMEKLDPAGAVHADLVEIHKAARRSADLTRQLLAFARKQTIAPVLLDLNETVERMLKMLRRLIGENIDLAWQPGQSIWPVKMDPSQLDQIVTNLCVNTRDAIEDVGKICIETENTCFDRAYCVDHPDFLVGDFVRLAVTDNGCGMDKRILAKVFEPFFTTKEVGQGTGLGLAMVYGIVKQNGGFIDVHSRPGQGTTFEIYLPRQTSAVGQEHPKRPTLVAGGSETVLVVEDEPAILKLTRTMLERHGYNVLSTSSPSAAIRLAQAHAGEIHLLLTDVIMPGMNGRDLARNLLSLSPNLKQLFMSGFTADIMSDQGVVDKDVHFIQKPFTSGDLAVKVQEALLGVSV